jgi:hypothetical protein
MPSKQEQLQLEQAWNRRMREFRLQRKTQKLKRLEIAERNRTLNFLRKIEKGGSLSRVLIRFQAFCSSFLRRSMLG